MEPLPTPLSEAVLRPMAFRRKTDPINVLAPFSKCLRLLVTLGAHLSRQMFQEHQQECSV